MLSIMGTTGLLTMGTGIGAAKPDTYPTVDDLGPFEDMTVDQMAAGAAKHPNQDRIAIVTAAFGDGIQLYIADGTRNLSDTPETVYQITQDAVAGVYEPEWKDGNRLEYVMDFTRYTRKITPSYVVLDHKTVTENVLDEEEGDD